MDHNLYEQLALALYRVTEHLPPEEPLRVRMREACLDIRAQKRRAGEDPLVFLNTLLALAEKQDWGIDANNFRVLRAEFSRLSVNNSSGVSEPVEGQALHGLGGGYGGYGGQDLRLSPRQKKLVAFIESANGAVQIKDVRELFPKISPRTIRRDLDDLVGGNILKRSGKTNGTTYAIVRT